MMTMDAKEKLMKCAISTPERMADSIVQELMFKTVTIEMLHDAGVITKEEYDEMSKPIMQRTWELMVDRWLEEGKRQCDMLAHMSEDKEKEEQK